VAPPVGDSSIPILLSPANRSLACSASAATRATIRPTVAQATRSSSRAACLEVWTASHAAVSSNAWVWPAPWCAQGTATTTARARAADPGRVGLQVGADGAKVQRPPAPPALAPVNPGTAPPTRAAAALDALAGSHRHHDRLGVLVEPHPLDKRLLDTEQPCPSPCRSHTVSFSRSSPQPAGTVVGSGVQSHQSLTAPTDR
jgi:hypothetical protein